MIRAEAADDVVPVLRAARRVIHTPPAPPQSYGEEAQFELTRLGLEVNDLRTTVQRLHRAIVEAEDDQS